MRADNKQKFYFLINIKEDSEEKFLRITYDMQMCLLIKQYIYDIRESNYAYLEKIKDKITIDE